MNIETGTYAIETLTPVLVQGGDLASSFPNAFFRVQGDNDHAYMIDIVKVQICLQRHYGQEAVNRFAAWMETFDPKNKKSKHYREGIGGFLRSEKFEFDEHLSSIIGGKVPSPRAGGSRLRFIRNGRNQTFLPGSTLKGAIRTAVLWKILHDLKDRDSTAFEATLQTYLGAKMQEYTNSGRDTVKKRTFASDLVRHTLQAFLPDGGQGDQCTENGTPFTDLLRAVKVQDSSVVGRAHMISHTPCRVLCLVEGGAAYFKNKPGGAGGPIHFQAETFSTTGAGGPPRVKVILDLDLLKRFRDGIHHSRIWGTIPLPFTSINDLMNLVFQFYRAVWRDQQNVLAPFASDGLAGSVGAFYRNRDPEQPLRIGWGSGLTSTTLGLLLKECPNVNLPCETDAISGRIGRLVSQKGFGFIDTDKGSYFFHNSACRNAQFASLNSGTDVLLSIVEHKGKMQAGDVWVRQPALEYLRDQVVQSHPAPKGPIVPKSLKVLCSDENIPSSPMGWIQLRPAP